MESAPYQLNSNHSSTKALKLKHFWRQVQRDKYLFLLIAPVIIYYVIFHYIPMYGVVIAFENFSPTKGILRSPWVGFKWFEQFFQSFYFFRIMRNTLLLNVYNLLWGFPVPIIFALLLNEVRSAVYKRAVQTVSYLPHFISVVISVGIVVGFLSPTNGIVNMAIKSFGFDAINFMSDPKWFRTIYITTDIWQEFGWGSIIYLAALTSIDPVMYEASKIDGANRWQQLVHITLPSLAPTIIILFILRTGRIMSVGFEKIILLYNPSTYETADVISSFTYRRGLLSAEYSFGAAVGLFNSVINFIMLVSVNKISKKVSETSLW